MAEASAHDQVRKCLDDLRAHIEKITRRPIDPDVDNYTHLIETITAAYMMPKVDPWIEYGLTKAEARIMNLLASRRGHVFSKDAIMNALYFDDPQGGAEFKIVDVFVCKIRHKLEEAQADQWIVTHWGYGYSLVYANAVEESKKRKTQRAGLAHLQKAAA